VIDGGYSDVTVVGGCHPTKGRELYVTVNGIHICAVFSSLSDSYVQSVVTISIVCGDPYAIA
jgi:hypothetical protein